MLECKIYFAARFSFQIYFAARFSFQIYFAACFSFQIYFAFVGVQNLFCFRWSAKFILRLLECKIYFAMSSL